MGQAYPSAVRVNDRQRPVPVPALTGRWRWRRIRLMWFDKPDSRPDWTPAMRHLRRVDPVLARVIERVGPCTLHPRRDYFVVLCKAIFTQQISTAVAAILFARFQKLFPRQRPTPQLVLNAIQDGDGEVLKRCGLSRQKAAYIQDLA